MLLAAMLLTACSKDDEVKAATLQEAGKTLASTLPSVSRLDRRSRPCKATLAHCPLKTERSMSYSA